MRTRLIRTTTADGLVLAGLIHQPEDEARGTLVHVHGSAGSFYGSPFLDAVAEALTDVGWTFVRGNLRGHAHICSFPVDGKTGEVRLLGNALERFDESRFDIAAWMDSMPDAQLVALLGHSLGASKAVHYAANPSGRPPDGLVLASPVDMVRFYSRDERHNERLAAARRLVADGKGEQLLDGHIQGEYMAGASHYLEWAQRGTAIDVFNVEDTTAPAPQLAGVTVPVLAFAGDNEGDLFELLPADELALHRSRAVRCPRFEIEVIPGAGHIYTGFENQVAARVTSWLDELGR